MNKLPDNVIDFFHKQSFVIVSSLDADGSIHASCKDIVKISQDGRIYLFDLYQGRTLENLKRNPTITITAVDEHKFQGFCLKGRAKIVKSNKLKTLIMRAWEKKITQRIARRLIKNIGGEQGHPRHPEARLPKPERLIVMEAERVIDLTPAHLK